MMKLLIMGLPGSGKTTLAAFVYQFLRERSQSVCWINADIIRQRLNNWEFSEKARLRQARRLRLLLHNAKADYGICDFVAPTEQCRRIFAADVTVWMDTLVESRFADTNAMFVPPRFDFRIRSYQTPNEQRALCEEIYGCTG